MALVAQAQVMSLLQRDLLRRRRRAKRYVALEAPIRTAFLLCHAEMHGVLGECLVLDRRRRLLSHLLVARSAARRDQLRRRDLLVVAVLTGLAIGVADVAVSGADPRLR